MGRACISGGEAEGMMQANGFFRARDLELFRVHLVVYALPGMQVNDDQYISEDVGSLT